MSALVSGPRPPVPAGPFLVAGLGAAGRAAVLALAERGVPVRGWDGLAGAGARARVESTAAKLERAGATVEAGGDGVVLLSATPAPRCVVKSPGIAFGVPLIAAARERGIEVIDELELGWRLESRPVVAVTGTNGKSTVAMLAREVLAAGGVEAPVCGNTRFGPPLSAARRLPAEALVCEVSSFQLEGCPAFVPEVAVLTNLAHDHLYRHRTMDGYAEAKRSLFIRDDSTASPAVLNADDRFGAALADELRERGAEVVTFGRAPTADWRLLDARWSLRAARLRIAGPAGELDLETRLPGDHNASNAVAALAVADACGIETGPALAAISRFEGVPGRFERVASAGGAEIVVDFAHNPDGIARALDAARAATGPPGRLIVVLSALDLYDRDLCREMGEAAASRCDLLLLTTERLAPGDARAPIAGLEEGAAGRRAEIATVAERRDAIAAAVAAAGPGDLVLVLGRGERAAPLHELSGAITPIDDAGLVREAAASARPGR